jgi:hypothetical protein
VTVVSDRLVFKPRLVPVGMREGAHVTVAGATLLLGQSFLRRFRSWSIDNDRGVLVLD